MFVLRKIEVKKLEKVEAILESLNEERGFDETDFKMQEPWI